MPYDDDSWFYIPIHFGQGSTLQQMDTTEIEIRKGKPVGFTLSPAPPQKTKKRGTKSK